MDLTGARHRHEHHSHRDQPARRRSARGAGPTPGPQRMNHAAASDLPLLEVRDLTVRYGAVTAARDISFQLKPGEALGIVGESGSGKSSIAGAMLDFLGPTARISGEIIYQGRDLLRLS